jgi:hypothetical protein
VLSQLGMREIHAVATKCEVAVQGHEIFDDHIGIFL